MTLEVIFFERTRKIVKETKNKIRKGMMEIEGEKVPENFLLAVVREGLMHNHT